MTFIIHVQALSPEGDSLYDFTLDAVDLLVEPGTPAESVQDVRARLAFLPGLTGKGQVGRRGNSLRLDLPANMDARLRKEMEDLLRALQSVGSPFPQEPIGPGARWENPVYGATPGGASGSAVFELVSLDGERATTHCTIQQTSRDQPIPVEYQTRPDASERMLVRAQTQGETVFRLDRLWPSRCRLETSVQADLSAAKEDPPRKLRLVTELKVLLEEQGS
ncbi:hypothetical protein POL68_25785 [Stigmatella sp. ncwal1]|uniref:Uncharacterized protein n=1 Tax=Stigmatella ashevillensis TaxID=2995309 RepID=A0ABT5DFG8_9BACT|nr:hypothetical protein [Stigmatella ashevillena]MDC0711905.1 hypothetical protein [Stigmatella ashevillena]